MNTHVVIMAGGVGSRLWPVSTPEKPKQFVLTVSKSTEIYRLDIARSDHGTLKLY